MAARRLILSGKLHSSRSIWCTSHPQFKRGLDPCSRDLPAPLGHRSCSGPKGAAPVVVLPDSSLLSPK